MKIKSRISAALVTALCALTVILCTTRATAQEVRRLLSKPSPAYPDVAKRLNLEGTVKIEVVVGPDGIIKDTKVIGGHPILVDSALKALRDWRYEKASTETRLELDFKFHP